MMAEFIYMIMERDAIKISELEGIVVIKIGRTKKGISARMTGYPKGSRVIAVACVENCVDAETELIELFDREFEQEIDHGREYYSGDLCKMQVAFHNFAADYIMVEDDDDNEDDEELANRSEENDDTLEHDADEYSDDIELPINKKGDMNILRRINGNFHCNNCPSKYKSLEKYKAHINQQPPCNERFVCPKCEHSFYTGKDLVKHLNRLNSCTLDSVKTIDQNPLNKCISCKKKICHSWEFN
jgi:uncharacterized C2H2 Zn-finger protein